MCKGQIVYSCWFAVAILHYSPQGRAPKLSCSGPPDVQGQIITSNYLKHKSNSGVTESKIHVKQSKKCFPILKQHILFHVPPYTMILPVQFSYFLAQLTSLTLQLVMLVIFCEGGKPSLQRKKDTQLVLMTSKWCCIS